MESNENFSISDYLLMGNCRTAALVSKNGSIDWCCMPEFHSPTIFAALLDRERGGFFRICPDHSYKSTQYYIQNTNIVEIIFENEQGRVRLNDGFSVLDEDEKKYFLFPDHEILRVIEGISGAVYMKLDFSPMIYYGKYSPELKNQNKFGIQFSYKENIYVLTSTLKNIFTIRGGSVTAEFAIQPGEKVIFSLSSSSQYPAIIPELDSTGWGRMQKSIQYWRKWSDKCLYKGIFKDQVIRSALVLKLLTHAPSGAIIAAPTTSLPEKLQGVRNWDYRYCWLRDASFTIRALMKLGYFDEANAYMNWILHATQLTRPNLQIVYNVYGESKIKEESCDWLSGYKSSRPVRIGNNAYKQFQLDVYGEVLDAVYTFSQSLSDIDHDTKKFIIGLGKVICELWDKPDEGIWEIRSSSVHHTHSKVMAWVGLDRVAKLCQKYNWNDAPLHLFKEIQRSLFNEIEEKGYNNFLQHYTRELGGTSPDASLLVLPLVGFCSVNSERMKLTIDSVKKKLQKNGFVYRYQTDNDGLPGNEGAFIICSFWLIENLAKSKMIENAVELFELTLNYANPSGLLSEEIDPDTKELLGNYPQGFSHIGLINAAISIDEASHTVKEKFG